MATTTINGHVSRALDFFERNDIYFAIGQPDPWDDENYPPAPTIETQDISKPIGFKKVENIYMVVPDEQGSIVYRDKRWRVVPKDQAIAEGARWVFIECFLRYDELPLSDYRQIGVYSRLKVKADVLASSAGKMNLLPTDVEDKGILEIIDNRKKVTRQIDQKEQLTIVVEF